MGVLMGFVQNAQYKKMGTALANLMSSLVVTVEKADPIFQRFEPSSKVLRIRITPTALMVVWTDYLPMSRAYAWFFSVADIPVGESEYELLVFKSSFTSEGTGLPLELVLELIATFYDGLDPDHLYSQSQGITERPRFVPFANYTVMESAVSILYDSVTDFYRGQELDPRLIEFARYQEAKCSAVLALAGP